MKRFEYTLSRVDFEESYDSDKQAIRDKIIEQLNVLGMDGWQVVNVLSQHISGITYLSMILMREIT